MRDPDDTRIEIFHWDCPNCGRTTTSPTPEPDDTLNCAHCDYTDEIEAVERGPTTTLGRHLAGRLGYPQEATLWTYNDWFLNIFYTICIGLGLITLAFNTYHQNWTTTILVLAFYLAFYYWLTRKSGIPGWDHT